MKFLKNILLFFNFDIYGSNSFLYKKKKMEILHLCHSRQNRGVIKCHQVHSIIWPKVITDIVRSDHSIGQQGQI